MKRTFLYSAVVATVLMLQAQGVQAKTADQLCTGATINTVPSLVKEANALKTYVSNLSAYSSDLTKITDDSGRYVICWDSLSAVKGTVVLANTLGKTVLVNNLKTYSGDVASPLALTVSGNTLLHNFTALGIKSAITLKDGASIGAISNITCDAGYKYEAIDITGKGSSTVDQTNITNCKRGINVMGSDNNILSALTIDSGAGQQSDLVANAPAIRLDGKGNVVKDSKLLVQGFDVGISVFNSTVDAYATIQNVNIDNPQNVMGSTGINLQSPAKVTGATVDGYHTAVNVAATSTIQTSILGGEDVVAIQIAKGITGVRAIQNNYIGLDTIIYADQEDQKAHRLLGVEWMAKHVSDTDNQYADRIYGKLMDQNNSSGVVEMTVNDNAGTNNVAYNFKQSCPVLLAANRLPIKHVKDGYAEVKYIEKDEKYFDCTFASDGKSPLKIDLKFYVRFVSNRPEVSNMSENAMLSDFGDTSVPATLVAGTLDTTDLQTPTPPPAGGDVGNVQDIPGPNDTENGGSNMTGSAQVLGGEAPVSVSGAGASGTGLIGGLAASAGGGCSLTDAPRSSAASSVLLLAFLMLPIPVMARVRIKK